MECAELISERQKEFNSTESKKEAVEKYISYYAITFYQKMDY
jgi:hypothetical protein